MKNTYINCAEGKLCARRKLRRVCIALFAASLTVFLLLPCLPVHGEAEIYRKVLRLHVIAASDSDTDQSIKLSVRDALLEVIPDLFAGCSSLEEAVSAADAGRECLLSTAREALSLRGADYGVNITLGEEYYPTRDYDGISLPAGRYTSLRVVLGDGEGRNWWCVLFPSLCLSAAKRSASKHESCAKVDKGDAPDEDYIAAGFTPEQYRTITETDTPKYKVRFKILELIGELFAKK